MCAEKNVKINLKDLYQFLICECRYGYTRNNHLMPSGAFEHVKEYIPKIAEQDIDFAVHTVKQLCEECIFNQLVTNFFDGEDDEFGNRKEAIEFIDWCYKYVNDLETWTPYNYQQYVTNYQKNFEPRYNIYEIVNGEKNLLTKEPLGEAHYLDFIFIYSGNYNDFTYRREILKVSDKLDDRRRHYIYHILTPVQKDFYVEHI